MLPATSTLTIKACFLRSSGCFFTYAQLPLSPSFSVPNDEAESPLSRMLCEVARHLEDGDRTRRVVVGPLDVVHAIEVRSDQDDVFGVLGSRDVHYHVAGHRLELVLGDEEPTIVLST